MDPRVVADARVVTDLAHQRKELGLAATDLEDGLAVEVVAVDPLAGERFGVANEMRRERLRLFDATRILDESRVEVRVEHESAAATQREPERPNGPIRAPPTDRHTG